jgi:isoleucyl-tRNA synthetase
MEDTELLAGQFIFKANASVIEILENTNTLVKYEPLQHSYPAGAVCTAPVPASIVTCSPKITGTCLS